MKIYNGGIKDWKKNGLKLESESKLPDTEVKFISSGELYTHLQNLKGTECKTLEDKHALTILDLRNYTILHPESPAPAIATPCPTIKMFLDDLMITENRNLIPQDGLTVIITETGNRDEFAIRYLSQFGYSNLVGLKFGMRDWIKQRYPTN